MRCLNVAKTLRNERLWRCTNGSNKPPMACNFCTISCGPRTKEVSSMDGSQTITDAASVPRVPHGPKEKNEEYQTCPPGFRAVRQNFQLLVLNKSISNLHNLGKICSTVPGTRTVGHATITLFTVGGNDINTIMFANCCPGNDSGI